MNGFDVLTQILNLRTHPFYPAVDPLGQAFQDAALAERTLDPAREQQAQIISLYFDAYDWSASREISGLGAPQGLAQFPNLRGLAATRDILVVVVAGWDATGVRSLANLIRYKAPPLVITPRLDTTVEPRLQRSVWAMSIVRAFINKYAPPGHADRDILNQIYKDESADLDKYPDRYGGLIASIVDYVRSSPAGPTSDLPVTMVIDDRENIHYSLWMRIYNICRDLVNLLVIPSHNPIDGQVGYNTFVQNKVKSTFIKAVPLDMQRARAYLSQRLAIYRNAQPAGGNDIAPFTDAALQRLYEKTDPNDQRPFELPIGKLNLTFRQAVNQLAAQLDQFVQANGPQALANLDGQKKMIQPQDIDQVRREINQGRY